MKKSNIELKTWEEQAQNRNFWRQTTSIASQLFEQKRRRNEVDKPQQRKIRQAQPRPLPSIKCNLCDRMFQARIGLFIPQKHHHE